MITDFDNINTNIARLALTLYAQEQLHLANNIANVNSAGYSPSGIDFQRVFSEMSELSIDDLDGSLHKIKTLKTKIEADGYLQTSTNTKVDLDTEMLKMTENSIKYKVLLSALKSKGELMNIVMQSK